MSKQRDSLGDIKCPLCNSSIIFRMGRFKPYAFCLCLKGEHP
jgi:ssDNA-binding Zn-finger/Zn-ribbon topoisomerase 1